MGVLVAHQNWWTQHFIHETTGKLIRTDGSSVPRALHADAGTVAAKSTVTRRLASTESWRGVFRWLKQIDMAAGLAVSASSRARGKADSQDLHPAPSLAVASSARFREGGCRIAFSDYKLGAVG